MYDYEVEDEEAEGVWGYLIAQDAEASENMVLRKRSACPLPKSKMGRNVGNGRVAKQTYEKAEEEFEEKKTLETPSGGYLIGRHPECGKLKNHPISVLCY
jgi:serine/threonine-protein kinase CHEK2